MKALIKKILFRGAAPAQYVSMRFAAGDRTRKATLDFDHTGKDVSERQWILCQTPFVLGVWFSDDEPVHPQKGCLTIVSGHVTCAAVRLSLTNELKTDSGRIALYKVTGVSCYQLSFIHRTLLFHYFRLGGKNPLTLTVLKQFCALYSYPRKVIVVCFEDGDYYNFFPMDFQGHIAKDQVFVLGLRHTNVTLPKILEKKKVVVCEVSVDHARHVYFLGKHHSTRPPALHELPFGTIRSKLYQFPLPDFISSYRELQIVSNADLGSHMLMMSKVLNEHTVSETENHLHHIHFVQFLQEREAT